MNIFEDLKVWATDDGGKRVYLSPEKNGVYKSEDGDFTVSITEKKRGNMTAVYVSAEKKTLFLNPD